MGSDRKIGKRNDGEQDLRKGSAPHRIENNRVSLKCATGPPGRAGAPQIMSVQPFPVVLGSVTIDLVVLGSQPASCSISSNTESVRMSYKPVVQ
eukprot:584519-Hanusia_phi.AAC.1